MFSVQVPVPGIRNPEPGMFAIAFVLFNHCDDAESIYSQLTKQFLSIFMQNSGFKKTASNVMEKETADDFSF